MDIAEYTVSEISFAIKRCVENTFSQVRVRGEIFGAKRADSGHWYLSLKDPNAVLSAVVWKGVAYIPTAWLNVPNGYQLAEDYGLLYEIGWGYDTVSVKVKPIDEVQMAKATLNVNFEDENGVTLDYTQTFNSPDGKVGETYQFVEGENYFITLPEGYELNEEYPTVEVAYGEQETVIIQVKSQNAEQPDPGEEEKPDPGEEQPNPGDEQKPNPETPDTPSTDEEKTVENTSEESEKANDVDTAVAMPLAAAFGTMSVSLAGMVALLRRKQK